MAFKILEITNWSDKRDSAYRIAPADGGHRHILLNTDEHMSDILVDPSDANKSIFKYFDNPKDRRESYSVIHANNTVASIIAAADTPFDSNYITLPIHKNNNPEAATVDTTIPVTSLSFADRCNRDPNNHCWVVYYNAAFKRREVLTHLSIEDLEYLSETGSTTASEFTSLY